VAVSPRRRGEGSRHLLVPRSRRIF
jgi:hypothetical protein